MTDKINMEITNEDLRKFETVEHDMTVIKQHFKNTKFAFLEREAKVYFLESIESNLQLNLVKFFEDSKKRLKDVKEIGVKIGDDIKELSIKNYELKREIDEITIDYDKLNMLKNRYEGSEEKFQREEQWQELDDQYAEACDKARELVNELENLKEQTEKLNSNIDSAYVNSLKERKQELERKQKRWSRVFYDQMLLDSFCWYDKMTGIIEMFLGSIGKIDNKKNGFDLEVNYKNIFLTLSIRNGMFTGLNEEGTDQFKNILKWCVRLDNPRIFFLLARNSLLLNK